MTLVQVPRSQGRVLDLGGVQRSTTDVPGQRRGSWRVERLVPGLQSDVYAPSEGQGMEARSTQGLSGGHAGGGTTMRRLNSVPCAPLGLNSDNQCIETRL